MAYAKGTNDKHKEGETKKNNRWNKQWNYKLIYRAQWAVALDMHLCCIHKPKPGKTKRKKRRNNLSDVNRTIHGVVHFAWMQPIGGSVKYKVSSNQQNIHTLILKSNAQTTNVHAVWWCHWWKLANEATATEWKFVPSSNLIACKMSCFVAILVILFIYLLHSGELIRFFSVSVVWVCVSLHFTACSPL